jgi:hypothetical protein
MKTDRVLAMQECLDEWCVVSTHVNPPATNAHHVPIAIQVDADRRIEVHGCRCDRWGHPCPGLP